MPCSLGVLVHRVSETSLELMVKQLTTKLLNPKKDADVQRETAAIGIKAVVQEVSSAGQAAVLVQHATGPLLSGVQREVMLAGQAACLPFLSRCLVQTCQEIGRSTVQRATGPFLLVKRVTVGMTRTHLFWVLWCRGTCAPARAFSGAGYVDQHSGDQLFHSVRLS